MLVMNPQQLFEKMTLETNIQRIIVVLRFSMLATFRHEVIFSGDDKSPLFFILV